MTVDATSWVEIDRAALRANLRVFRRAVGRGSAVCAVVKSNAYGHGMIEVARTLRAEPVWGFGVADLSEALALRRGGIRNRILAMSSFAASDIDRGIAERIDFAVFDARQAALLAHRSRARRRTVNVHVKIDVGTTRLGMPPDELAGFLHRLQRLPSLRVSGIMSHLADAEGPATRFTEQQIARFRAAASPLAQKGILQHIGCSASAFRYPASRCDMVRVGIGLYGIWPSAFVQTVVADDHPDWRLNPVLTWNTRLLRLRRVRRGTSVGYGRAFAAPRAMLVGTVPVGYWDGFRRSLSNRGAMLVGGRRCRVLGRVCMNLTMIDCSSVPHPRVGQTVTIIGGVGEHRINADDVAGVAETIPYDILCGIHPRLPRILV